MDISEWAKYAIFIVDHGKSRPLNLLLICLVIIIIYYFYYYKYYHYYHYYYYYYYYCIALQRIADRIKKCLSLFLLY